MDTFPAKCARAIESLGGGTEALLIVPPFADLYHPSLGVHLLQAAAEQAGMRVRILYANLLFAALGGESLYNAVCFSDYGSMLGERIFSATAFGLPPLGYDHDRLRVLLSKPGRPNDPTVTFEQLESLERQASRFSTELGQRVAAGGFRAVGASTTFQQTAAAVALLAAVKRARSGVITLIGGANCEGQMAHGIASLNAPVDYIFSGECESAFPDFLQRVISAKPLPPERIVRGAPCLDMDSLPEPSFDDYFAQLENALPDWREKEISLPYETSRGCWWGARQHCTFCGLNGETMAFRQKSPDRAIAGAKRLVSRYRVPRLFMVDNILPHSYFRTVLPRLAEEVLPVEIFYETKSNLNLEQVRMLRSAGIARIQPGIEALSSSLLRRMKKGVLARQNLALLRHARAAGLALVWNLLCRFPGDQRQDYEETLAIMPLIHHLSPPTNVYSVSLDRFSPYFNDPAAYGVSDLQPTEGYSCVFPPSADLPSLAYHFKGKYESAESSWPTLRDSLNQAFREWRSRWQVGQRPPVLNLVHGEDGFYSLTDTRGLEGAELFQFLDEEEAHAALIGGPLDREPRAAWAIERKLAVALDGWCTPLAVADLDTWRSFEVRQPQPLLQVLQGGGSQL